jgi:hypothetical protein
MVATSHLPYTPHDAPQTLGAKYAQLAILLTLLLKVDKILSGVSCYLVLNLLILAMPRPPASIIFHGHHGYTHRRHCLGYYSRRFEHRSLGHATSQYPP